MEGKVSRGQILVVEDNLEAAEMIRDVLVEKGYAAEVTGSVAEATRLVNAQHIDLALVDLTLKDGSGHDLCRHIRGSTRHRTMPIIVVTGAAGLESMAAGFESGADYYLTKPLAAADLLLWVRALLRRVSNDWSRGTTIGVPGLRINPDIFTVWVDREIVRGLTGTEFSVLLELARVHPKALSQAELFKRVWGRAAVTNTLAVHMKNLRRKLGFKGGAHVVTTPEGYRLE